MNKMFIFTDFGSNTAIVIAADLETAKTEARKFNKSEIRFIDDPGITVIEKDLVPGVTFWQD